MGKSLIFSGEFYLLDQFKDTSYSIGMLHPDLLAAKQFLYGPNGWPISDLVKAPESEEYGAFEFQLNDRRIQFRAGKKTPKKAGFFVTLWKRSAAGVICPYDAASPFDLYVVSVREGDFFGQFVFPKALLFEKKILSKEGQGGKLAFRVYPPWIHPPNKQAEKTQKWQLPWFCKNPSDLANLWEEFTKSL